MCGSQKVVLSCLRELPMPRAMPLLGVLLLEPAEVERRPRFVAHRVGTQKPSHLQSLNARVGGEPATQVDY